MGTDWAPIIIAVVLFILLSPGLLFQMPARTRAMEFGNMCTSGISILVHSVFFFGILTILVIAIGVHIRTG
ncbi:AT.I.24-6 protein, putative (DUF 3339) [Tasmannia lanceolata]|uniref:AT.I.24-6 protein, putative (DUF 3339) n=1 Tax=Tasmannia lanceolata TaxID=3420 RepID=UPI004063BC67